MQEAISQKLLMMCIVWVGFFFENRFFPAIILHGALGNRRKKGEIVTSPKIGILYVLAWTFYSTRLPRQKFYLEKILLSESSKIQKWQSLDWLEF